MTNDMEIEINVGNEGKKITWELMTRHLWKHSIKIQII